MSEEYETKNKVKTKDLDRLDFDVSSVRATFSYSNLSSFLDDYDIENSDFIPIFSGREDHISQKDLSVLENGNTTKSCGTTYSVGLISGNRFRIYEGNIVDNMFTGSADEFLADGSLLYKGSFLCGQRHGLGLLYNVKSFFRNCNTSDYIFKGFFKDGRINGNGVFYFGNYSYKAYFSTFSCRTHLQNTSIFISPVIYEADSESLSESLDMIDNNYHESCRDSIRYEGDVALIPAPPSNTGNPHRCVSASHSPTTQCHQAVASSSSAFPLLTSQSGSSHLLSSHSGHLADCGSSPTISRTSSIINRLKLHPLQTSGLSLPDASNANSTPRSFYTPRLQQLTQRFHFMSSPHLKSHSTTQSPMLRNQLFSPLKTHSTAQSPTPRPHSIVLTFSPTPKAHAFASIFDEVLSDSEKMNELCTQNDLDMFNFFFIPDGCGEESINGVKRYIGEFSKGLYEGKGLYLYPNGDTYSGEFKKGRMMGQGTYFEAARGMLYRGVFDNGIMNGNFNVILSDGFPVYNGQLQDGVMHGMGQLTDRHVNGVSYVGMFANGKLCCDNVKILYKGQKVYEGGVTRNWCIRQGFELDSDYLWNYSMKEDEFQTVNVFTGLPSRDTKQLSMKMASANSLKTIDGRLLQIDFVEKTFQQQTVGHYASQSYNCYRCLFDSTCFVPHKRGSLFYYWKQSDIMKLLQSKDQLLLEKETLQSLVDDTSSRVLYCGFFDHGHFSGMGTLFRLGYDCDCLYTGEFNNDYFHGDGLLMDCDGCSYAGCFDQGFPCGEIRIFNADHRCVYIGLIDGCLILHGPGRYFFEDGSYFNGTWNHGSLISHDMIFYSSSQYDITTKWTGDIIMSYPIISYDLPCCWFAGKGSYTYSNGDVAVVTFENRCANDVKIFSRDGDLLYKGDLDDAMRCHGKGMLYLPTSFLCCSPSTPTQLSLPSSPYYSSSSPSLCQSPQNSSPSQNTQDMSLKDFASSKTSANYSHLDKTPYVTRPFSCLQFHRLQNIRQSRNLFSLRSTSKISVPKCCEYNGYFRHGLLDGSGRYYANDDVLIQGEWNEGQLIRCMEYKENQIVYEGEMRDGNRTGFGKMYSNGCVVYSGDFYQGLYDGFGKEYDILGHLKYDGSFKMGVYQGSGTKYYSSGKPQFIGCFDDGLPCGITTEYDEKGRVIYNGNFERGQRHGKGVLINGNEAFEGDFEYGALVQRHSVISSHSYEESIIRVHSSKHVIYQPLQGEYFDVFRDGDDWSEERRSGLTSYWNSDHLNSCIAVDSDRVIHRCDTDITVRSDGILPSESLHHTHSHRSHHSAFSYVDSSYLSISPRGDNHTTLSSHHSSRHSHHSRRSEESFHIRQMLASFSRELCVSPKHSKTPYTCSPVPYHLVRSLSLPCDDMEDRQIAQDDSYTQSDFDGLVEKPSPRYHSRSVSIEGLDNGHRSVWTQCKDAIASAVRHDGVSRNSSNFASSLGTEVNMSSIFTTDCTADTVMSYVYNMHTKEDDSVAAYEEGEEYGSEMVEAEDELNIFSLSTFHYVRDMCTFDGYNDSDSSFDSYDICSLSEYDYSGDHQLS